RCHATGVLWLQDWPLPVPEHWLQYVNQAETASELTALRRCVLRGAPYPGLFIPTRGTSVGLNQKWLALQDFRALASAEAARHTAQPRCQPKRTTRGGSASGWGIGDTSPTRLGASSGLAYQRASVMRPRGRRVRRPRTSGFTNRARIPTQAQSASIAANRAS